MSSNKKYNPSLSSKRPTMLKSSNVSYATGNKVRDMVNRTTRKKHHPIAIDPTDLVEKRLDS